MTEKRGGARRRPSPKTPETGKRAREDGRAPARESGDDPHLEAQLDAGLDGTFPASDPVSINPGSD
jgi:hypothetical protein